MARREERWESRGRRAPTSNDVYVLEIGGTARCVQEAKPGELFEAAGFSPDGSRLLVSRANGSLDNDLFVLDLDTKEMKHLTSHEGVANYAADWAVDGKSLWVVTNEGREYPGLFRWDLSTGKREGIRTPQAEVEFATPSRDGRWVAVGVAKNGGREIEIVDVESGKGRILQTGLGVPASIDFLDKTTKVGFTMNGPRDPSDVTVADFTINESARVTTAFLAGIPRESLVAPEPIRYKSFDGVEIEGLPTGPRGRAPIPRSSISTAAPRGSTARASAPFPNISSRAATRSSNPTCAARRATGASSPTSTTSATASSRCATAPPASSG